MEMVRLKNGAEEFGPTVKVVTLSLQHLMVANPIAFDELVEKARHPEHLLFGNAGQTLHRAGLLEADGEHMHDSVRNVVVSAVEGEGLEMRLVNPTAPSP